MGRRNFLIEGGSGTGKTSVCDELLRRGIHAIHGDRELAYRGDPQTGAPAEVTGIAVHSHQIWRVDLVEKLVRDQREPVTYFCGGTRNLAKYSDLFDGIFVLEVDLETLTHRLEARAADEWGGRGRHAERDLILELHRSRADVPQRGIPIDATAPVSRVVDDLLARSRSIES